MPRPILLPDSNVWIYLVEHGGVETVYRESKSLGIAVAACPAVGYEFLRAENAAAKRARMQALCRSRWLRLMPDAFTEAAEVRRAVERHRPAWVNPHRDLGRWNARVKDWQTGWWYRVRTDPREQGKRIREVEGDRLERARSEAIFARDEARRAGITFDNVAFDVEVVPVGHSPAWWDGRPFEAWRIQLARVMMHSLESKDSGYHDWLAPWLAAVTIEEDDWYGLWLREVSKEELPLAWLRWAFTHVQATRSTSNGTPVDNQIATYLTECDVFVTADKVFAECIEKVRPESPVRLGRAVKVSGTSAAVDQVIEAMREMV